MLSLIRPSSSPCSHPHPDTLDLCPTVPAPAPGNIAAAPEVLATSAPAPVSSSSTSSLSYSSTFSATTAPTGVSPQRTRPHFKPASAPLNNAASYKAFVAQFTANAPQPYGVIPPRKKRTGPTSRSAGSVSKVSLSSRSSPTATSPPVSSSNSLELLPTTKSANNNTTTTSNNESSKSHFVQPLFHSLQSLLPESTSSSSRLGFWANLKAQYLASAWSSSDRTQGRRNSVATSEAHILLPPAALRVANSAPVAAVDATPLRATPLSLSDAPLSLPNLASPACSYHGSVSYPVSVAAMDKFKVVRSDTIPLKTFTYLETPVVDRPRSQSSVTIHTKNQATKNTGTLTPPVIASATVTKDSSNKRHESSLLPPPLPRHLLTRETRSNADYLRMMAAELRMIRSRKLISPLKPRGYLPRRKDPFRFAKSTLCETFVRLREEDDHPLNDIMVGSWSSVSSSDTYMSASSSMSYHSSSEEYY